MGHCAAIFFDTSSKRALALILHCADKIGVHLAWRRRVAIVVHQFVSYDFVKLILYGLTRNLRKIGQFRNCGKLCANLKITQITSSTYYGVRPISANSVNVLETSQGAVGTQCVGSDENA